MSLRRSVPCTAIARSQLAQPNLIYCVVRALDEDQMGSLASMQNVLPGFGPLIVSQIAPAVRSAASSERAAY